MIDETVKIDHAGIDSVEVNVIIPSQARHVLSQNRPLSVKYIIVFVSRSTNGTNWKESGASEFAVITIRLPGDNTVCAYVSIVTTNEKRESRTDNTNLTSERLRIRRKSQISKKRHISLQIY